MEFERFLQIVGNEPVFETGLLFSGAVDPNNVRKQLSRWTASGKVYQLRRGLYCLAPPFQKVVPHPFLIANRLVPGSYVSKQSALAYYGMIPEGVPQTTSVAAKRPQTIETRLGSFDFRHIQVRWLFGYQSIDLGAGQKAFIALPEKALLDLVYLQPKGDSENYLHGLRLQALEQINIERLFDFARKSSDELKLLRAAQVIQRLVEEEEQGYSPL